MNEIEKLLNLGKSINRGGYHRCGICGTVSNQKIETNVGDYKEYMSFVNDPKDPMHFLCVPCFEEILEIQQEYEEQDKENGRMERD